MSMLAIDTQLRIRGKLVTMDFRGGIKERVDVNPDDPENSVRLRVVGHKMSAKFFEPERGSITIEQNDVDVDAKSGLRIIQNDKFENVHVLPFTLAIEQPDTEMLMLTTVSPAILIATITQFPPKGDVYQLENPVDLVDLEDPDTTVVTIEKFPVKIGGL